MEHICWGSAIDLAAVMPLMEETRLKIFGAQEWIVFLSTLFGRRGTPGPPFTPVKRYSNFLGNSVKTCWKVTGTQCKLVWNFGSRDCFQVRSPPPVDWSHTHEWVTAHTWWVMEHIEWGVVAECVLISASRHLWFISHIWMRPGTHMMSHGTHWKRVCCKMCSRFWLPPWLIHFTHMNASRHTHEDSWNTWYKVLLQNVFSFLAPAMLSHVTRMHLWHDWVVSHIWLGRLTHMTESWADS